MSAPTDAELAVVLRQAQWLLDDAARDLPAGRLPDDKLTELAVILEDVAGLLRQRAGQVVIDSDS